MLIEILVLSLILTKNWMNNESNINIINPNLINPEYPELLKVAVKAAIEAGNLSMEYFGKKDNRVKLKWDLSPVSDADKAVGQTITEKLRTTGVNLISEEERIPPYKIRKNWDHLWIVDPIDGTRNFISGGSEFSINIGLIKSATVVMGVIYIPASQELFYGLKGVGAFKQRLSVKELDNDLFSSWFAIGADKKIEKLVIVSSRSNRDFKLRKYIEKIKLAYPATEHIRCGSSIKYCLMAEGKANLFARFNTIKEWDTAAGQAIVEASGCIVMNIDGDLPVLYNKKKMLTLPNLTISDIKILKNYRLSEHN
jgi:3'(2'), 5'-bisphosphate nucleotidase